VNVVSSSDDRVFSPRFFMMCGFSFTAFLSAFQLLPTAPFRILELGGSKVTAGLFLGLLTYASAIAAPLMGALADRVGRRRTLVVCGAAIAALSLAYAGTTDFRVLLGLAALHGVFWAGLLSASAAYVTEVIPPGRRAEGLGYWGLAGVFAVAAAPSLGLWIYGYGWLWLCVSVGVLNVAMAVIAWTLEEDRQPRLTVPGLPLFHRDVLEWRVLVVAVTLFLYAFGYGAVTSFVALYADANAVSPRGLYFTIFAITIVVSRPFLGRLADRTGHRRVFLPCLALIVVGYVLLALGGTRPWLIASGIAFGIGFGSAYPIFVAYVIHHVGAARRGAAFGAMIAAFDTGIGTGSIVAGAIVQRAGFGTAYAVAAVVASLAIPYFLLAERRFLPGTPGPAPVPAADSAMAQRSVR
jgi:MFS family permease